MPSLRGGEADEAISKSGLLRPSGARNDVLLGVLTLFFLVVCFFAGSAAASPGNVTGTKKLWVGERLVYSVRWGILEVGRGEAEVKEIVPVGDRQAYHIVIHVRSAPVLDWIYKVRDVHHSYIDVERLHTLRYEKILSEGHYRADEVMEYDQTNHTARYHSRLNGSRKEMMIPPDVQDQLSCGFWFRLQELQPGSKIYIPVNADEKNWDLEVKILKKTKIDLPKFGEKEALEVEPEIQFQGIFVKRGKIRSWVGTDERQIPLKMRVKIPVLGSITAHLVEYQSGGGPADTIEES